MGTPPPDRSASRRSQAQGAAHRKLPPADSLSKPSQTKQPKQRQQNQRSTNPVAKTAAQPAAQPAARTASQPSLPMTPGLTSSRSPWAALRSLGLILTAAGLLIVSGRLAIQLIVNPQALLWINQYLPNWIPFPVTGLKPPQTLPQIRSEIQQAGQIPGEPLDLGKNVSFLDKKSSVTDLLVPVLAQQPNCQTACNRIVELRLYQSTLARRQAGIQEPYYQLVNQMAIAGPEESFAIAPLIDARSVNQGSTRSLPLTELSRFEGKVPSHGVWLNLKGQLVRGEGTVSYGQIVYYNPERFHLSQMLNWTSTTGQDPIWQEVTGGGLPELVVDQTVGMEPQFKVYQVKQINFLPNPNRLELISFFEAAFKDSAYTNALLLARSGLWSPSWQALQSFKRQNEGKPGGWSELAQAQMDVIHLHAQATQAQADQSWASPGQQVLADLIDGRWTQALKVFEANLDNSHETTTLLKTDSGRIQNRIEAALAVNPSQTEVKLWGALLIAAKQGRPAAIAWLKQQPKTTPAEMTRANALTNRLDAAFSDSESLSVAPGKVVGAVQVLPQIKAEDWLKPKANPPLQLEAQQAWYLVQVAGFHDGKRWQLSTAQLGLSGVTSAEAFWKLLGLGGDPVLNIVFWGANGQQQTVSGSIKAVRVQAGSLQLLVAGDRPPNGVSPSNRPRPLAYTDSALQWLSPSTTPLADLVQQQPTWAKQAIPLLAKELKKIGELPAGAASTWEALNQLGAGNWTAQSVPLTGNAQSDIVLTIYPEEFPASSSSRQRVKIPRTLIFSAAGRLLYSEFSTDAGQTLLAIADLGDSTSPALVIDGANNYTFRRWSTQRNRFE